MATIDYRKPVDDLRTTDGRRAFAAVEAIAPDTVTLAIMVDDGDALTLDLQAGAADALFDAIGGALRALAAPGAGA